MKSLIKEENKKRNEILDISYNPLLGEGSPIERVPLTLEDGIVVNIPVPMAEEQLIKDILKYDSLKDFVTKTKKKIINSDYDDISYVAILQIFNSIRIKYDFEFWAASTISIKDKITAKTTKFILNRSQRKILKRFEDKRTKWLPIRAVLLKARQMGGSTLVEFYASWLQLIHHENWNSCIIGNVDDQARTIRGMYTNAALFYPPEMGAMTLKPFEGSSNHKQIVETGGVIYIGSMQHPEAIRSSDLKIAHFSETASWKATTTKKPTDLIQSIKASIPYIPDTLIVEESTAKGVGNYFHSSWLSAKRNNKSYDAIFTPWFYMGLYRKSFESEDELDAFIENMTEYDMSQWDKGASLEGINWYKNFLETEFLGDEVMMQSEFPTTDKEAFQSTGHRVFINKVTEKAAKTCVKPRFRGRLSSDAELGEDVLTNISFDENFGGNLWIWEKPDKSIEIKNRYIVSVDIGGTTKNADWSIIRVFDRYWMTEGGVPQIVATVKFHIDQDRLAWAAVRIAEYYNHALLAIESNSLRTEKNTEGDGFLTILDSIKDVYDNIYARKSAQDNVVDGAPVKYGFHTNSSTKSLIINCLKAAMRDSGYIEKDIRFIDEAESYEYKPDGTMGAVSGKHDDIVMSTAIGLWISLYDMPLPAIIVKSVRRHKNKIKGAASF